MNEYLNHGLCVERMSQNSPLFSRRATNRDFMADIVVAVPVSFRMTGLPVAFQLTGHGYIEPAEARAGSIYCIDGDTDCYVGKAGGKFGAQYARLVIQRQMGVAA